MVIIMLCSFFQSWIHVHLFRSLILYLLNPYLPEREPEGSRNLLIQPCFIPNLLIFSQNGPWFGMFHNSKVYHVYMFFVQNFVLIQIFDLFWHENQMFKTYELLNDFISKLLTYL